MKYELSDKEKHALDIISGRISTLTRIKSKLIDFYYFYVWNDFIPEVKQTAPLKIVLNKLKNIGKPTKKAEDIYEDYPF